MVFRLVLPALIFLCVVPAQAFNALGHKVVAEIAWRQLQPAERQPIVDILRRHPRFDADFAGKMTDDVMRGDKAVQWAEESHELAKSFVYDDAILEAVRATLPSEKLEPVTLSDAYLKEAGHRARLRIIAAGVRLAGMLGADQARDPVDTSAANSPGFGRANVSSNTSEPLATQPQMHWLNTSSNVRHNQSCQWYGNTKQGRYCAADEGKSCGECGG